MLLEREGPHPDAPVFFMSNHLFPPLMLPTFIELNRAYDKVTFICDGAFSRILDVIGINFIPVDTVDKARSLKTKRERMCTLITRAFGIATGSYYASKRGRSLLRDVSEALDSGSDIFMTATCVSTPNAPWLTSIGSVCKTVNRTEVYASFVNVGGFLKPTVVNFGSTIADILEGVNIKNSREIVRALAGQYGSCFNSQ